MKKSKRTVERYLKAFANVNSFVMFEGLDCANLSSTWYGDKSGEKQIFEIDYGIKEVIIDNYIGKYAIKHNGQAILISPQFKFFEDNIEQISNKLIIDKINGHSIYRIANYAFKG